MFYKGMGRQFFAVLSLLMLLLFPDMTAAEGKEARPAAVLVITHSMKREEGRSFRQVISNTVIWELERSGLLVIRESDLKGGSGAENIFEGAEIEERSLFDLAGRVEADFVLTSEYLSEGKEIFIKFSWFDMEEERKSASASKLGKADLTLDEVIGEAVSEILAAVKERLAGFYLPGPEEPVSAIRDETRNGGREKAGVPGERGLRGGKHFELSTGFAPFLVTGAVSKYFKVGYMASLYGNFRIDLAAGQLGIGWFTGINIFRAEGVVAAADNLLIPIGPDFRYVIGSGLPLGLFVHVSGGPAIFIVDSTLKGGLVSVMPYVMGGIGFSLPFTDHIGIAADMSYTVFFEKSTTIMGFTPAGYLYLRF